jgi:hypothetical protein
MHNRLKKQEYCDSRAADEDHNGRQSKNDSQIYLAMDKKKQKILSSQQ